jgi:hypothetical protein
VAQHVVDPFPGITRPPQYLLRFGVRNQMPSLQEVDATRPLKSGR